MNSSSIDSLSDRNLAAELAVLKDAVMNDAAGLGVTPVLASAFKEELDAFVEELDAHDAAQAAEDATGEAKDARRESLEEKARQLMRLMRAHPAITDEKLASANVDVYDRDRTASRTPESAPVGRVEYSRLKHTIHFRDSAAPTSKAKPKGTKGCEIWRYTGDAPPASEADFDFVALDSATPYVALYTMADAGKKVRYMLRWLSNNGEAGEWSEMIEATING